MPTTAALHRAHTLVGLRRWSEAVQALQPALADPHAGATPWCLLAQCQLSLGRTRDAERSARRAIGTDPREEWGHRLLSVALSRRGKNRAAVRACQAALELEPERAEALHLLGALRLAQRRRREAERLAARNVQLNPHHELAWQSASDAALARRRWADAERHARQGLAIDPHDADLALNLGRALSKQGRTGEAGEAYAAAARSNPTDQRPRRALGRLGVPAVGIGLVSFKLLPFAVLNLLRLTVLVVALPPAQVAALLAAALGGVYGITELLHLRARRRLSPQLRAVALRQRRQDSRGWVTAAAALSGVLALRAFLGGDLITGTALIAALAAAVAVHRRLPRPSQAFPATPAGRWGRAVQSIRRRFR